MNKEQIGYFLKRNDIDNIAVTDLLREIQINLFEAHIIKLAIKHFQEKKLSAFDCAVGDWKCQTRTSIIIDIIQNTEHLDQKLSEELKHIEELTLKNQNVYNFINGFSPMECQELRHKLKESSLLSFFQKNQIYYNPSEKITLLSLCFLTTLQNNVWPIFGQYQISINKTKALINIAKKTLCHISIQYEQKLAELYSTNEEKKTLEQIEFKEAQCMTALFSGFVGIFKKMLINNQPLLINQVIFCACGGTQKISVKFFFPKNNQFQKTLMPQKLEKIVTVIQAYQYPGSLCQLQSILNVPHHELGIPEQYYKTCQCAHPTQEQKIDSLQEAIMAFFAQHPQFTNGAQINFEKLNLENSDLKKEYDHLMTLQGFNRDNMSKFHIIHMYPATIAQVLAQQKEWSYTQQIIQPKANQKTLKASLTI